MRINNNIGALNSWRGLYANDQALSKSLAKLSSGLRINSAADDAGGLGVSETLRAQVRGLQQAERNTQDGVGFLSVADGALEQVHGMLQRVRELAVQSANGTLQDTPDRANLNAEATQLLAEITRITGTATTFNGTTVFGGTTTIQIGANAADTLSVSVAAVTAPTANLATQAGATTAITAVTTAINTISAQRAQVGARINRLDYAIANQQITRENLAAAESRIRDTDMASEMTNLTKNQILVQSATAMLAQANARPQSVLALLQ